MQHIIIIIVLFSLSPLIRFIIAGSADESIFCSSTYTVTITPPHSFDRRQQTATKISAQVLLVFANNLWARFVVGITFYWDSFCGQINTICELFKQNNPMVIKIMDSECRLWVNADGRISGGAVELMNERNRSSIVIP